MTYTETIIDDFAGSSLDTGIWYDFETGGVESGGNFTFPTSTGYGQIVTTGTFNIKTGILAFQITNSGTATASCQVQMGVSTDDLANTIYLAMNIIGGSWSLYSGGDPTLASVVASGSLGASWTNGNWLGIGNVDGSNNIYVYSSSDKETWTQIGSAVVTPNGMDLTAVQFNIVNGYYTATESPTYKIVLGRASFFTPVSGGAAPKLLMAAGVV